MTRQSIQRDKIFSFKTKGSTFATEQNNILISPISSFEILKIGKLSGIFSLNPHWGSNRPCPWSSFLRSDEKVTGHSYLQHFTALYSTMSLLLPLWPKSQLRRVTETLKWVMGFKTLWNFCRRVFQQISWKWNLFILIEASFQNKNTLTDCLKKTTAALQ